MIAVLLKGARYSLAEVPTGLSNSKNGTMASEHLLKMNIKVAHRPSDIASANAAHQADNCAIEPGEKVPCCLAHQEFSFYIKIWVVYKKNSSFLPPFQELEYPVSAPMYWLDVSQCSNIMQ